MKKLSGEFTLGNHEAEFRSSLRGSKIITNKAGSGNQQASHSTNFKRSTNQSPINITSKAQQNQMKISGSLPI